MPEVIRSLRKLPNRIGRHCAAPPRRVNRGRLPAAGLAALAAFALSTQAPSAQALSAQALSAQALSAGPPIRLHQA